MLFFLFLSYKGVFCLLFNTFFRIMYCAREEKLLILRQIILKNKNNQIYL